ncbi:fluoride efflux transporter CrcB [Coprobacter sp.]
MKLALWVGVGGFLGSISRYLLSKYIFSQVGNTFPWSTLAVNLLGCFIIGLLIGWFSRVGTLSAEYRMFLMVGFCGGFTTFSTFASESLQLLKGGEWLNFLLYAVISVLFGIILTALGSYLVLSVRNE